MRKESQTDQARAKVLTALAKELDKRSPKLEEFIDSLSARRSYKILGKRTIQWARRLLKAYRVFPENFEALITRYGVAKVSLLAKLDDAQSRLHDLEAMSARKLEAILRAEGEGKRRGGKPFQVPQDLLVLERILFERLKALRHRDPGLGWHQYERMRKIGVRERSSMRNLQLLLTLYRDLIDYFLKAQVPVSKPRTTRKGERRPPVDVQVERVTDKELCRRLADLRRPR